MRTRQAFIIFRQFIPFSLLETRRSQPQYSCICLFVVTILIMTVFVRNLYLIWELHILLCFEGFNLFRWLKLYNVDWFYSSVGRAMYWSGCYSPSSYHGSPGSVPNLNMWSLRWTKWHWDAFISECFRFTLSVSFHQCPKFIFIYILLLPGQMDKG